MQVEGAELIPASPRRKEFKGAKERWAFVLIHSYAQYIYLVVIMVINQRLYVFDPLI